MRGEGGGGQSSIWRAETKFITNDNYLVKCLLVFWTGFFEKNHFGSISYPVLTGCSQHVCVRVCVRVCLFVLHLATY